METAPVQSELPSGERRIEEMSDEELVQAIQVEGSRPPVYYENLLKHLETVPASEKKRIWQEIAAEIKQSGALSSLENEGVGVLEDEENWQSPYPVAYQAEADYQRKTGREVSNCMGYYLDGKIYLLLAPGAPDVLTDNLASLASGNGLGSKANAISHENIHGFQEIDPEKAKSYQERIAALSEEIRIREQSEGKRLVIKTFELKLELRELQEKMAAEMWDFDKLPEGERNDLATALEMHANMFADPLKYLPEPETKLPTREAIIRDGLLDFPIRHFGFISVKHDDQKISSYEFMQTRERQAWMAFRQIEALRALGLNNREIGRIVHDDRFDPEKGYYRDLQAAIFQEREKRGISREDLQAIIEKFELETIYRAIKVRNFAQDVLSKVLDIRAPIRVKN